ncbi:MAG: hypothetical protein QOD92_1393 [Acidimicrobiaceae bacterium]
MTDGLAVRTGHRVVPDASRVISRLFVPGQELVAGSESRASRVVERILALDDSEVERALSSVTSRFAHRHRALSEVFSLHADRISNRITSGVVLSDSRRQLLGATFTHEFAIEAASVCNPSIVAHPDQRDAPPGSLRFIMSLRAIGEGHQSSIGFRTGSIDADGMVTIDNATPYAISGSVTPGPFDREVFYGKLSELGSNGENAAYVLDTLDQRFSDEELDRALARLRAQRDTRRSAGDTTAQLRAIAARGYTAEFPTDSDVSERVLWPATPAESHGVEDARFVRFVDDDGSSTYYATYTAFDGVAITQQLLETSDFVTFTASPIVGPAAANKGLALFPRRIGGRFAAMSRWDRETNSVAFSDNPRRWGGAVVVQHPVEAWETIQLGNCGSPIETPEGWLVLTHGVGPVRTYSIGAILLDLDDPTVVIGRLRDPLLVAADDEQDGYVPNVVYSCGALVHGGTLVLPYGISDGAIGIATVSIDRLLTALHRDHSNERRGELVP